MSERSFALTVVIDESYDEYWECNPPSKMIAKDIEDAIRDAGFIHCRVHIHAEFGPKVKFDRKRWDALFGVKP